jgi:hypothetical protein
MAGLLLCLSFDDLKTGIAGGMGFPGWRREEEIIVEKL